MKKRKKAPGKKVPAKQAVAKRKMNHIPAGYHTVTPYMSIRNAAGAIDFYKKAFGAKEVMRMPGPEGRLGHAEISIDGARIMLSDEYPEMQFMGPETRGGTTVHIHVYVKDVDAVAERAAAAGAKVLRPVQDQFYGDRSGSFQDPFGHIWHFATHKEDVSKKEMARRAQEMAKKMSG
jgi:PhnB protein